MSHKLMVIGLIVIGVVVAYVWWGFSTNPDVNQLSSQSDSTFLELGTSPTQDVKGDNLSLNPNNNQPETPIMKQLADFDQIVATQVILTTSKGNITFSLYRDQAPITTANFLNLAKSGFYNGIVFHRVIPDFMAQVGDPLTKEAGQEARWGTGGPGYTIPDEFDLGLRHNGPGAVSMANSGPNTGSSQFFITYEPTPWLDGKHAIFGQVTSGMAVLKQIKVGDKIISVSYQ